MNKKKLNVVEWAMRFRQIVVLVVCCLMAIGIVGLGKMKKNEFPDFTIRQGIVVAVAPGYSSTEMEEQVMKPLEDYIFTYKEVRKERTSSVSRDGMAVVQVRLNDELNNKDEFWSKFKHGISLFKSELPAGVLAVRVMDDFGDTSALLVSMESEDKTYRELEEYMNALKDHLRPIEDVGRLSVHGMQNEQISVYVDPQRLARYAVSEQTMAMTLFSKGFATTAGRLKSDDHVSPIYVSRSLNSVVDVEEMILFADALGNAVRVKDIARVVKEYPETDNHISNNGTKCLLLSVEMKKDKNIVAMGEEVNEVLNSFEKTLPESVKVFRITDQSKVVDDSVNTFLKELLVAVMAVIAVVMLLFPIRVALVAASTIPVSIFMSLGLFFAFGIELNTVTLAALIVTLGMIVDNSIVIIDSYLEMIGEGRSRWHAAIKSATHFFKSIFSATLAISITFFPFLVVTTGMIRDFLNSFPWAIMIILMISLLVAELLVPFMLFAFVRKPLKSKAITGKPNIFERLQVHYNKFIEICFRHPKTVIGWGIASVVTGVMLMARLPQQMLPTAERNQFAVEIYLPVGTAVEKTSFIADSLEHILQNDERIVSVCSFKGCSSPRFSNSYAPVMGGTNFAQFIVNTASNETTVELLDEYAPKLSDAFPEAFVRFKQLGYSEAVFPVEVRLTGDNLQSLNAVADSLIARMRGVGGLIQVRKNNNEQLAATRITLNEHLSRRMGISNMAVETSLAMRYGGGMTVGTVWEGDYDIPVVVKTATADCSTVSQLAGEPMAVMAGVDNVPLRQIATIETEWQDSEIAHRNGLRTITISADTKRGENIVDITNEVKTIVNSMDIPEGIAVSWGGEEEQTNDIMPKVVSGLVVAIIIIFFILVTHFKRITTATLLLCCLSLCLFGTALGVVIQGVDFSVTCILGVVSLMGVLVRNCIIMIDYAEELRQKERLSVRDAIFLSAQRRMRPIFLTSAAASVGVIPMILGGNQLWMPMGTVICYGTMITMLFILTVVPVVYWKILERTSKNHNKS